MRLLFTVSCLDNFHLQKQKQSNFCRIFYVLVGFCYPCIFFPCNFLSAALGFTLLDLQPDLAGLRGIFIPMQFKLSFILDYSCSVTRSKEYSVKKRKPGQKETHCLTQFVPPMEINIFSCSSIDLGRWSVTCLSRATCVL